MTREASSVIYWDTSAIVSALFADAHSAEATRIARSAGTHLLSTLAWAESQAVIARIEREGLLAGVLVGAARDVLVSGPWRRLRIDPDWSDAERLARAWPLRGADLWHLATAKELQRELPELGFLTFDSRLSVAALGEGFRALG